MNVLKKYKYILICIVVVMLIGGLSLKGKEETNEFVIFNTDTEEKDLQERFIYIDIKGEVRNPGVYKVAEFSRVFQLISMAGGSTNYADLDAINLSLILHDQQVIYVPSLLDELPRYSDSNSDISVININSASVNELDLLPGIGPSTAQSIVDYRINNGPFIDLKDIMNVSGIGESTFAKIEDYITIN